MLPVWLSPWTWVGRLVASRPACYEDNDSKDPPLSVARHTIADVFDSLRQDSERWKERGGEGWDGPVVLWLSIEIGAWIEEGEGEGESDGEGEGSS
jgi:hypothetical protein